MYKIIYIHNIIAKEYETLFTGNTQHYSHEIYNIVCMEYTTLFTQYITLFTCNLQLYIDYTILYTYNIKCYSHRIYNIHTKYTTLFT